MASLRDILKCPPLSLVLSSGVDLHFKYLGVGDVFKLPSNEGDGLKQICQFLIGQLKEPVIESSTLEELNDRDLKSLLDAYAQRYLGATIGDVSRDEAIESFLAASRVQVEELRKINAKWENLTRSFAPIVMVESAIFKHQEIMRASAMATIAATVPQIALQQFVPIPQVTEFANQLRSSFARLEKAGEGYRSLEELDLAFTLHLWDISELAELGTLAKKDAKQVVRRIIQETRDRDGHEAILELIAEIPFIAQRCKIVRQALAAHRRRLYHVAVPALLTQIEGIITDILLFLGKALIDKGKVKHAKKTRKTKSGKSEPLELKGLYSKTEELSLSDNEVFAKLGEHITDELCARRNGILHGADVTYGSEELSAKTILVLLVTVQLSRDVLKNQNQGGK